MTQIKPFIYKLEKTLLSILPNYKKVQFNYTYMIFTECLNLCDVSENISNTKTPNINMVPEHQ